MVNNDDWPGIEYLTFLREYGKYFTINRMLSFESVKQRLARESPLSFLEFNYMILQAYDFLELHRRHKAELQFGGSDQWGNIINGVELARKADGAALFGCTAPLLTTSDGKKMGKTADGAVWLNADLLTPFAYWQFWRNTDDADVGRFLRIFTELPRAEIEALEALQGAEINQAKKVLADEATRMLHGDAVLDDIHATAKSLFASGGGGGGRGRDADRPLHPARVRQEQVGGAQARQGRRRAAQRREGGGRRAGGERRHLRGRREGAQALLRQEEARPGRAGVTLECGALGRAGVLG